MIMDERITDIRVIRLGYFAWVCSVVVFACGIFYNLGVDSAWVQSLVAVTIIFSETYSLRSFVKRRTNRLLLIIFSLLFWAISFCSRGMQLIGDEGYGVMIAIFILSIVFIRRKK